MVKLIDKSYIELKKELDLSSDDLYWKAYNKSIQTNAEDFIYLISFNETDKSLDIQKETSELMKIFDEEKLSKIYDAFIDQFYNDFKNKVVKLNQSLTKVFINKLTIYYNRFKQR